MSGLIEANDLGKEYPVIEKNSQRWKNFWVILLGLGKKNSKTILKEINFKVKKGESLAIIGENGAGKSTLLKLLAGVLHPSHGSIKVNGRVGALLELGAGFNPEYSGLKNIMLSGMLAGLKESEIKSKIDTIIEFADIGAAIHEPVKNYSSGMVVRLGFAVITEIKPDILITDEVLAVGDESFQQKCIQWIEKYLNDGGTLLLVSHSMYHVKKLCKHALWLKDQTIYLSGNSSDVADEYLAWHHRKKSKNSTHEKIEVNDPGYRLVSFTWSEKMNQSNSIDKPADVKDQLQSVIRLHSPDGRTPNAFIGIVTLDGQAIYGTGTEIDGFKVQQLSKHVFQCHLQVDVRMLLPGQYIIKAHAMDPEGLRVADTIELEFVKRGQGRELGVIKLEHEWF
ncbi:MAG: ABC transporter ATP-binding protein [bacterium]